MSDSASATPTDTVLVEFPATVLPPSAEAVLFELTLKGVRPLIAHPERNLVLAAEPEFKVLAHNKLTDSTRFDATPSIADGKLWLRSEEAVYCIGTKSE